MLKHDDADIDALLGSVVGGNGQVIEFPAPAPRKERARPAKSESNTTPDSVEALSEPLVQQLKVNAIIDPASIPLRFSRLKHMSSSPLHYWQAAQEDKEDTIAMRFGRGVHALCLGLPVKQWTGKNRNSNDYKKFVKDNPDVEVLTIKEWDKAHGIFEAIKRHPIANEVLFDGTVLEETIEWELMGRKCTSRPDARRGTDRLIDLKTTKCAEPRKFERDAMFRGYHSQFSFYGRAMRERFGAFPQQSLCVAVETKKPFPITVLELTAGSLAEGEKAWRLWFERARACEASNYYPAYTEIIEPLDVVGDAGEVKLIIDDEEFDFDED